MTSRTFNLPGQLVLTFIFMLPVCGLVGCAAKAPSTPEQHTAFAGDPKRIAAEGAKAKAAQAAEIQKAQAAAMAGAANRPK